MIRDAREIPVCCPGWRAAAEADFVPAALIWSPDWAGVAARGGLSGPGWSDALGLGAAPAGRSEGVAVAAPAVPAVPLPPSGALLLGALLVAAALAGRRGKEIGGREPAGAWAGARRPAVSSLTCTPAAASLRRRGFLRGWA